MSIHIIKIIGSVYGTLIAMALGLAADQYPQLHSGLLPFLIGGSLGLTFNWMGASIAKDFTLRIRIITMKYVI